MANEKEKWTAERMVELIRTKYSEKNRFVVLEQVADSTGSGCHSWIDVAVVDLWPSDGMTRRGIEVKVSRSDFLNELKNPNKNAWVRQCMHEFWFACAPGVAKEEELPEGVGLMVPRGGGLGIVRHASRKAEPKCDDFLIASLARSMDKAKNDFLAKSKDELLATMPAHKEAIDYKNAVSLFLHQRRGHSYVDARRETVLDALMEAVHSDESKQIRDKAFRILDDYQHRMLSLVELTVQIAAKGIRERDECAAGIISLYGGDDNSSVKWLRAQKGIYRQREHHAADLKEAVLERVSDVR